MENITLGNVKDILIYFSSVITAGGIILAFALKVGKKILNEQLDKKLQPFNDKINKIEKIREEQFKTTNEEIKKIKEELNDNSLNTMKNTICNDMLPISERITIGKKYIDKGGNGAVKIYIHELEERYEKELKKGRNKNEIK